MELKSCISTNWAIRSLSSRIPGRLFRTVKRLKRVSILGQTIDHIIITAYVNTDIQRVRHNLHLLCSEDLHLQSWDAPGKPMNDNLASYWDTLGAPRCTCLPLLKEGGATPKQSACRSISWGQGSTLNLEAPCYGATGRRRNIPLVDTFGSIFSEASQDCKPLFRSGTGGKDRAVDMPQLWILTDNSGELPTDSTTAWTKLRFAHRSTSLRYG